MYAPTDPVRTNIPFDEAFPIIASAAHYADSEARRLHASVKILINGNGRTGNIIVSLVKLVSETDRDGALESSFSVHGGWKRAHIVPLADTQTTWVFDIIREYLLLHGQMTGVRIPHPQIIRGSAPDFTAHLRFHIPVHS